MNLKFMLKKHEGIELKPYVDTVGKLTIGVGRNLQDVGISEEEADYLLDNDIAKARLLAEKNFAWFGLLDSVRQDVVIMMIFNLGLQGFSNFKKTISEIQKGNFTRASIEMLDSKWAEQVGKRANTLSLMMETGRYP